ncbi:MAG: ribosomal subunit interface protein [Candidatus Taylorbacteria bacterium RIFCSPLOWO2_01_FULL_45_15b]|uniref:Ribosomal subunit interface protein n=1 Tax=Candidatus Taylorbacteria bacterium RIFCSPLOWO2_01_FULL_45_15b TaxID=1802319 RepID=A0A1G2NEI7_9BACT|nr:MAG: ribosomal subunit interface protein [Candidatus Taylorbacteria bacterium RIFCSPLOWO2_01_FULL_45_15b]
MFQLQITTKATNIEVTPAISDYVQKKISSLEKFIPTGDTSAKADVEVAKTTKHHAGGDVFRAEINFHLGNKHLRAECIKEDLYAAIDEIKDEIARELKSSKEKDVTLLKRGGRKIKDILRGIRG